MQRVVEKRPATVNTFAPHGVKTDLPRRARLLRNLLLLSPILFVVSTGAVTVADERPPGEPPTNLQQELEKALHSDQQTQSAQQPLATLPSLPVPTAVSRAFQSLNPDLSFIGDFALAAFHGAPFQLGGHDPAHNGFNVQSGEIALGAAVDPYLRFDANLAFSPSGFEFEEGYATTLGLPANLQLRAGKFLTRFGRQNQQHPHAWDFADQPLVMGKFFGPDNNRGPGLEVSDLLSFLPWYAEVVLSGSTPDVVNPNAAVPNLQLFRDPFGTRTPLDITYVAALKQFFPLSDDFSLAFGLSSLLAPSDATFGNHARTEIFGTDLYLKYRPIGAASFTIVSLTVEAMYRRRFNYEGPAVDLHDAGGYAQLFWRFAQRWGAGLRYDMASGVEGDAASPDWTRPHHRGSVALTFWPTEFSRIRLQGNYFRSLDSPDATTSVFLAFEFAAGAHGAHAF
jgi:hypothetical protein